MRSVPPRGSGWALLALTFPGEPTRYRAVVLNLITNAQPVAVSAATKPSTDLVKATQDYKASSAELLALQQSEVTKAAAKLS